MLTVLSAQDRAYLQANNWRAKEIRKILKGEVQGKPDGYVDSLLRDILDANYEILDESNPSHVDTDTLPSASPSPAPAPEVGAGVGRRFALFVGHNQGTGAKSYRGEDEWATRNRVAKRAKEILEERGYVVGLFYRDGSLGYTAAMQKHGQTAREFKAEGSMELHFNCYNGQAKGAEILVYSDSTAKTLGRAFVEMTQRQYPRRALRSGGVKIQTDGRGAGFNRYQPCPSGIYEPCFADNPLDWDSYWQPENVEREAKYVADIVTKYFELC